ncbi:YbjN domain-containing protein [Gleimia hominis]|uniref:YbjN domain-containing protein n=1 Tax=Gleimia hominis TaxID=595468 RepID=UPI000C803BDA|nr:YbjN domain-containing protein [Gleimia hominis]WIK64358.1 YbjN domain-containing protein [Gleimia hominis]
MSDLTVTFDRVKTAAQRLKWEFDVAEGEDTLIAGFEDAFVTVPFQPDVLTCVTFDPNTAVPLDQFDAVAAWANQWNTTCLYGNAYAKVNEHAGNVALVASAGVPIHEGATDAQLDSWLLTVVGACVHACSEFRAHVQA